MQNFSVHTHTTGFDGDHSVFEMVQRAKELGFSHLGVSNHFIVFPGVEKTAMYQAAKQPSRKGVLPYHMIYSSSFEEAVMKFERHYQEIDEVQAKTGFKILKGMEVDFFEYAGWEKGFKQAVMHLKPDYLIGSTHFLVEGNSLLNMHDVKKKTPLEQKKCVYAYWENVAHAIESGFFNFMAHLDLYKRVGFGLEEEFRSVEEKTVQLLNLHNVPAEINTGSLRKMGAGYTENSFKTLLGLFSQYQVPVFLSDDAHCVDELAYGYELGEKFMRQMACKVSSKIPVCGYCFEPYSFER